MSRIRTIKPEFWTSEQVISCSLPARLLFIGFWNFADDNGIHPASSIRLKAEIFPCDSYTEEDIKKWIAELISHGLLQQYVVNDKSYLMATSWKTHQRIDKPNYKYPLPENSTNARRVISDYSTTIPRQFNDLSTREWNGKERKG